MSRFNGSSGSRAKDPETAMTWAEAIVDEQRRNGRSPKSIGLPNAWPSKPRPLSRESHRSGDGADREVEAPEVEVDLLLGNPAEKAYLFGGERIYPRDIFRFGVTCLNESRFVQGRVQGVGRSLFFGRDGSRCLWSWSVPEKKPFYELEQKIYASCDDFGSGDMIRRDPHSNELARKWNEKAPKSGAYL